MRLRRQGGNGLEAWPGYVDALSTLLMVIIFVLLVFVLAQAFLSVALSGRDVTLDRVNHQLSQLSNMLALERGHSADLTQSVARLRSDLETTTASRDTLASQLTAVEAQVAQAARERDAASARADLANQQASQSTAQLADARQKLADMQKELEAANSSVQADKATITARLADLANLAEQTRALAALRDQLEKQAQDAAARATTEQQRREAVETQLADEQKLGSSARAQIALLSQQLDELRGQIAGVAHALDLAEAAGRDKDAQIASLGQRLNTALAAKVEELQRYRSEFFGKLRDVLASRPGIQIVGDRFVFQSEVLFPVGSADITPGGAEQIRTIAHTIVEIAKEIPSDIHWILRVDGHADKQPISGGAFASNWELSAERAITVVKLLALEGVPEDHLAATAFGDTQPLDPATTPAAYAKNRRIEIRLTDR